MEQELCENLKKSTLREAHNVLELVKAGASIDFETDIKSSASGLAETYQARAEHLSQFTSHHATRLKKSTEEFGQNLRNSDSEEELAYARVDDTLLGGYVIWFIADTFVPLGCLYVIGKTEVSHEIWEQIWNEA